MRVTNSPTSFSAASSRVTAGTPYGSLKSTPLHPTSWWNVSIQRKLAWNRTAVTSRSASGTSRTAWYGTKNRRHGAANGWRASSAQNEPVPARTQ